MDQRDTYTHYSAIACPPCSACAPAPSVRPPCTKNRICLMDTASFHRPSLPPRLYPANLDAK
ncbi:hypothetical protein KC19_VG167500 [Ceratodon purpureus]|uniref:Uncharacterized protein n=1 Tax=Ceratodon purpureus TaxID=3225 RepID=A0A8T0HRA9_CERPU|nr:hypothetical protein KC19_VG167500 [Ceratodon purpureus]